MMTVAEWKQTLKAGKLDKLKQLYGDDAGMLVHQKKRYAAALDEFAKLYPQRKQVGIFSAPGRTEVGGNHTDHQHGCVLAAAVNLDVIAVVGFSSGGRDPAEIYGLFPDSGAAFRFVKEAGGGRHFHGIDSGDRCEICRYGCIPSAAGTLTLLRRCSAAAAFLLGSV